MGLLRVARVGAVALVAALVCQLGVALPLSQTTPEDNWYVLECRFKHKADYAGNWCYKTIRNVWREFPPSGEGAWLIGLDGFAPGAAYFDDPNYYGTPDWWTALDENVGYFTFPGTGIGVTAVFCGVNEFGQKAYKPLGYDPLAPLPFDENLFDPEGEEELDFDDPGYHGAQGLLDWMLGTVIRAGFAMIRRLPEWEWPIPDSMYSMMNYVAGFNRYVPMAEIFTVMGILVSLFAVVWALKLGIKVLDWIADLIP